MIFEMTYQFRVTDIKKGQEWYEKFLNKAPDFVPHEGFAEWELVPGSWLQIAEGIPVKNNGPLRIGIKDITLERDRLIKELGVEKFIVNTRKEVPVKWATFADPWGNLVGLFEYENKTEEADRIQTILGK